MKLSPKQEPVTAEEIADALLRKVVVWATEKEAYIEMLKGTKELRNKCTRLEDEKISLRDERDRLLKLHNIQAQRGQLTSVDELKRLAG